MLNIKIPNQLQQHHDDVGVYKKVDNTLTKDILKAPLNIEGSEGSESLALFHRSEIKVGSLVGAGSFSEVFEITGFSLQKEKKMMRRNSKAFDSSIEPSRRRKRQDLIEQQENNSKDRCTGKALKSRYVIKQLHQKLMADPKLFRRALKDLATEVSIMSSIEHPHIAQLHATAAGGVGAMVDGGKHDSYFIVLDRLVETLDNRIEAWNQEKVNTGPSYYLDSATNDIKMALKTNYALQIASALKYLHDHRIVFRDLKPQNIGFKEVHPDHPERDVLALFDFGLSRNLPSPEKANSDGLYKMSMVGTRRYMAPEVVISRWYNDKADTYSWSLVFFELCSQQRPFDGIQRAEHKTLVCEEGKRPKVYAYYGFPAELEYLLRAAWAQDISRRLTMGEVCNILERFLAGTIHEGCVHHPAADNRSKPTVIHDDSISSLISYTGSTDQTLSTTNSFTLDDTKQHPHEAESSGAMRAVTVPQAIDVSPDSDDLPCSSQLPRDHEDDCPPPRRVSLCERCMGVFTRRFRLFQ